MAGVLPTVRMYGAPYLVLRCRNNVAVW